MSFWQYWILYGLCVIIVFHLLVMFAHITLRFSLCWLDKAIAYQYESLVLPFIYWFAVMVASFWAFQFLGISFSANPNLYVYEVKNSSVAEHVLQINAELQQIQHSIDNPDDVTLRDFKKLGNRIESVTRSVAEQVGEMLYLIDDAERKTQAAAKKVAIAEDELSEAYQRKDQRIAELKAQIALMQNISQQEREFIKKDVLSPSIWDTILTFLLGVFASLIATHFHPGLKAGVSDLVQQLRKSIRLKKRGRQGRDNGTSD